MKALQRFAPLAREAFSPADSDGRDRAAFLMLLAFILVAPWLGSARLPAAVAGASAPMGSLLVPAFGFAIGALAFSSRSSFRSLRPLALPLGSALGVALLGCLQLIPVPDPALRRIAPVNVQIYHETAEILSLYGRPGPAARVSLAPDETAGTVLRLGGYAALLAATAHLLRARPRRRVFTAAVLAAAGLHVLGAAALLPRGGPFRGVFGSAADFGDYLLVILPLGIGVFWAEILTSADRGRDALDRAERLEQRASPLVVRGLACITLAAGIVLAGSLANVAAAVVAVGLVLALGWRHPRGLRRVAAVATAVVGAMLPAARTQAAPLLVFASEGGADRSLAVWRGSLEAWRSFPVLGAGLGAFRDAFRREQPRDLLGLVDNAQSDILQVLVTGGAVGLLLALLAFGSLAGVLLARWRKQKHREENAMVLAGIGALLALGLDGLMEFNLAAPAVPATLACIVGLALAAGDGSPREQSAALHG